MRTLSKFAMVVDGSSRAIVAGRTRQYLTETVIVGLHRKPQHLIALARTANMSEKWGQT